MKKLFLTLTLVIGLVVAFAGTNALDLSQQSLTSGTSLVDNPITVDGFTFTFSKGSGQTNPAYYAGIRLYADNTMTITAPEGENITSFTFTSDGNTYNFDEGENGDGTITLSGNVNTWTATTPANSITLKAKSAGQVRFKSISIETDGEGGSTGGGTTDPGTDPDPDPEPGDDDATEVTQEFTTNIGFANAWDANTLKTEAEYTATNTGITYTGMGIYCNSGYLMIRGKDAKGAFISWSLDYPIKQLVMKTSSGTSANANSKVNVYANGNLLENIAVNEVSTNYTIEIPDAYQAAGTVYKVESATTSYNQQFASFTYVKAPETGKAPAGLAFSESTATATLGQPFTAPTLSNTNNLDVTYTSSRPNVATIDASGYVEVLGLGVTTITAESAETDDYNAGLATYTLTVVPEDITVLSVQQAIDAIDNGSTANVKVKGFITSITEISVDYGNATYLIADTEDGEPALTVYRGKWIGGEKFTSEDQLEVGATVTVKGDLTLYGTTYELATNNEVVEYTAPVVPEPVYNQMGSYSMFVQPTTLAGEKTAEVATMTYDVYVNEADETDCYMQETGETNFLNGQKVNFNYNASAKTATVTAYYAGMLDNQNTWLAAFVYNPTPMTEPQGTYAFTFDKATGFAPAADEDAGLGWFITDNATDFSPSALYNGFYIVNEPVVEPEPEPIEVTFNFTSLTDIQSYNSSIPDFEGWTADASTNKYFAVDQLSNEDVTITAQNGTLTGNQVMRVYGTGAGVYTFRFNNGGAAVVAAPAGYKLTKAVWTSNTTATTLKKMTVSGTSGSLVFDNKVATWTANEDAAVSSLTFSANATQMMNSLVVTIEATDEPVEPDPVNTTPIYLMGSGNGLSWDAFPGMEVKPGEDGTYNFTIENLSSFKMSTKKAAGWDGDFNDEAFGYSGAFGDAVFNTSGMTVNLEPWGENQDMPYPGSYTIKINADRTSMTVKANFTKPVAAPDVFIRGAMNGWGGNPGDAWKFENTAWDGTSGTWTWTGTINAGQEFKIADANWGNINYSTNGAITVFNQPLNLTYNQQNSKFNETFVGTITLNVTNYTGHQATATFATEGEASFPETMYVFGNVNGKGISPDNGVAMTVTDQDNGIYTIENVLVGNEMDSGYGYIGFAEKLSANSSDWSTLNAYRFGPATADEPIEATGEYTVTFTDYNSFKVPADNYLTMTLDVKNMKLTVTAMTKDDQPTVEPNPAIEGEWTFTQDWHYAGDYSLGVQNNTYTATLEGNVVTFADEYDEYPMQAVFTAENTITFKVAAVGAPAINTLTQFPFTDGTKVTDAGLDPENFVWGDVTATFDPATGTLTFPEGTGLCYGFANAEGVVSYYSDAFDFVTAKKAGGDQPGEELSGTANMTYQVDMNQGMLDDPELTEPETEEVEVTYADGKLAFAKFGPGSGAITFDVDVTTGGATATDVLSYTEDDFDYYYADIESKTNVVYATLYNIEGADFTTMEVKPWGEMTVIDGYGEYFNVAAYNTVIELPFLIEGLPTQTPEEPDGWTKVTQELDGVSTDYYYQFEYQIMENFFGEGTLTLWGNYKWKDEKAPVGTSADNSAYIFVTGTGINGVLALDGNHTATTNAEDHKYVEGEECTFNFHCPFAGTELVETVNYTVRGSSSVDAIGAEEGEVIYFNLQGVRVENPTTGVYIRVANGKATKVAIR